MTFFISFFFFFLSWMAVCSGNRVSFCRCTTSPHPSQESVPTHVTELWRQPLRVGPESPSNIGYQSINGGFRLQHTANSNSYLQHYLWGTSTRQLCVQRVRCYQTKLAQSFVFYRIPVYHEILKWATCLPFFSIYLKVIKRNINRQWLRGCWAWLEISKHLHLVKLYIWAA